MKKTAAAALLVAALAGSACSALPVPTAHRNIVAELGFTISEDFLAERAAYRLPEPELVPYLSARANQEEFIVAYLPDQGLLLNLTKDRGVRHASLDVVELDSLIASGLEFRLVHNHNNRELDPDVGTNPLYWLAPSPDDLSQLLYLIQESAHAEYGIVSQYGLLTLHSSPDILPFAESPLFERELEAGLGHIQMSLADTRPERLPQWAEAYRGVLGLSFKAAR